MKLLTRIRKNEKRDATIYQKDLRMAVIIDKSEDMISDLIDECIQSGCLIDNPRQLQKDWMHADVTDKIIFLEFLNNKYNELNNKLGD